MILIVLPAYNDIVIASRYQPGARIKGLSSMRRMLSYTASWLFRIFHPIGGVRDYTCGYRAYRAELLKRAFEEHGKDFIRQGGFSCMVDILLKLKPYRPIINEVPLILRYDLKSGISKMKVARTIRETLGLLIRRKFTLKGWGCPSPRPTSPVNFHAAHGKNSAGMFISPE